jgi:hypothetical protein
VTAARQRAATSIALPVLAAAMLLAGAACSAEGDAATPAVRASTTTEVKLPSRLLGLRVVSENIRGNLSRIQETFLQSVGLFSFREKNDLLRATLQVGRFNDVAEQDKARFRDGIIGQLGSSVPVTLKVGDGTVYLSTGSDQNIFSWFDDAGFYVLSIRSDYPFPRTMMRKLLESDLLA